MYDYLGSVSSVGYGDYTAYGIAKYTAPEEQFITKVGTFVNAEGSVLDIEIYDDFDEKELTNLLNSKTNIYIDLPGYHTFDLPTTVNGDFYIKVRYYTPGFDFPIPVETFIQDYADPVVDTSVNWISPDNRTWNSCNPDTSQDDTGENLTIRAYAVNLTSPIALFESDKEKVCLGSNITYTFLENDSVNEFHWNFGTDATPGTADTKGPHQVTYSSEGRKTISLIVAGPNGSDTLTRHDYIKVVPEIQVIIPEREASFPVEQPYVITAFGADTYEWTPSDYLDKTTGQSVTATPLIPGDYTYIVTGHQGTCSARDTFTLSAKVRPPNDDVCSAYELVFPTVDTFTNRNATFQANEPAPPEGDCNTPLQWCVEGGLQNSIWFWFTAPSTGIVSFNTKDPIGSLNMDNQIAVYRADECNDILEDNWIMIAANDDYYSAAPYPCALEAVEVEPGEKYFVQIDGSAGGAEGEFILTFTEYGLGFNNPEKPPVYNLLKIYPNPGTGIFNFTTNIPEYHDMIVQVFTYSGQMIYNKNHGTLYGMDESSIDISAFPAGIYHVSVIFGSEVLNGKIILE
jgi:PKD repeat protein